MWSRYSLFLLSLVAAITTMVILGILLRPQDVAAVHLINQSGPWANEASCIDCHQQAKSFSLTGHANTLIPAAAPQSLELLSQLASSPLVELNSLSLQLDPSFTSATHHESDGASQTIPLHWCFGSGTHARTWVGLLEDSWGADDLVEFRYTWYSAINDFQVTPGQPPSAAPGYFGHLGALFDHPKTRRCFACHATRLQLEHGELKLDTMLPGVTCQRCHGPRGDHVTSGGNVGFNQWKGIDHEEAVFRCAECHRREEDVESEQIVADNAELARFQPVGLMRSRCFESEQMTCTVCHNPHLPLAEQKLDQIWQCIQCHDNASDTRPDCSAGKSDHCLECHMPKVKSETDLFFTDHWIRIRN